MKRSIWIAGSLVIVLLLAGAAFVGARMLRLQDQTATGSGGPVMMISSNGGDTAQSVEIQPSAELPDSHPDAAGLFMRREDSSIFVGTGAITMIVEDGQAATDHDGPEIEVVVTHDTTVYRDETMLQHTGGLPSGKIEQVVKPGSLEEISDNSIVSAWGEERGGRVLADVLVYAAPMVLEIPQ
ncbi:MAG: hypothetical protein GY832_43455 [Chloroflexi bacterium]|nr:hypothetical protein [Chloroflexota bacterium]